MVFGSSFNTTKCETTCRLCVGRIRLIRNKKTIALKTSQKEIAEQIRNGKQEYARIRVEGVIREKLLLQAFEILELYLELVTVRTQLIAKTKELPRDMMEAVSSIIYAAQRINDLPELTTLKALFASKYGKEYAAEAGADATASRWQVNANLIRCLLVEAPQPEEKLVQLSEIAQEHGVEWDLAAAAREMGVGGPAPGGNGGAPPIPLAPAALSGEVPAAAVAVAGHAGHSGAGPVPGQPMAHAAVAAAPQYTNAHQAAQAAQQAAMQAHAAAQYAAQMAAMVPTAGPSQPGAGPPQAYWSQHAGQQMPNGSHPVLPPMPSAGGSAGSAVSAPAAFARSAASTPSLPDDIDGPPPPGHQVGPSGGGGGASGGYLVRSNSDIQRDYDAALGPPVKGALAAPAAPPAPQPSPAQSFTPSSPPTHPDARAPPSAPPPPPQVEDEYEELTRRLEALKKS